MDGPRLRALAAQWLPWLVAAAILVWLFRSVPVEALRDALRRGPWLALVLYSLVEILLILPVDAWSTREALAAGGVRRGFGELFLARGASYLLGLLSYVAGQGGVGFYLAKVGVNRSRAAGAMLLMIMSNGIAAVLLAALGLLADLPQEQREILLLLIAGALGGIVLYLAVIALRVRWLAGWAALAPLFEAGVPGHLRAITARFPHILVLVLLQWGAFPVWGIPLPLSRGLALMPVALLIAALPITPSGLGTGQALQVLFFSPWSTALTPEARSADVLALSLAHYVFGMAWQAALGFVCLALLRRRPAVPEAEAG